MPHPTLDKAIKRAQNQIHRAADYGNEIAPLYILEEDGFHVADEDELETFWFGQQPEAVVYAEEWRLGAL